MDDHNTPLKCEELKKHMDEVKRGIDNQIKRGNQICVREVKEATVSVTKSKPKVTPNGLSTAYVMQKLTFEVNL